MPMIERPAWLAVHPGFSSPGRGNRPGTPAHAGTRLLKKVLGLKWRCVGAIPLPPKKLVSVTMDATVNAETMCALLRQIAALGLKGPVRLVLDNARYQHCALVMGLAKSLNIELLFLPSYSPNLNLIERLWKFIKKKVLK